MAEAALLSAPAPASPCAPKLCFVVAAPPAEKCQGYLGCSPDEGLCFITAVLSAVPSAGKITFMSDALTAAWSTHQGQRTKSCSTAVLYTTQSLRQSLHSTLGAYKYFIPVSATLTWPTVKTAVTAFQSGRRIYVSSTGRPSPPVSTY